MVELLKALKEEIMVHYQIQSTIHYVITLHFIKYSSGDEIFHHHCIPLLKGPQDLQ